MGRLCPQKAPENDTMTRPTTLPLLATPQPARHPAPTVKARSLAHLIFERPDLEQAERFLTDFGLVVCQRGEDVLYLRGTGPAPYCYRIHRAERALRRLRPDPGLPRRPAKLARLPGASAIEPTGMPGGGERVRLSDPPASPSRPCSARPRAHPCSTARRCRSTWPTTACASTPPSARRPRRRRFSSSATWCWRWPTTRPPAPGTPSTWG